MMGRLEAKEAWIGPGGSIVGARYNRCRFTTRRTRPREGVYALRKHTYDLRRRMP